MLGPTGCGKTYLVQKVAKAVKVPLIIGDATKFSGTGYVGGKVESLLQDLLVKAEYDLAAASRGIIYLDELDKIACKDGSGRDVSGRDVQNGLLKIIEGGNEFPVMHPTGQRMIKTDNILFIGGGAFSDLYKILRGQTGGDAKQGAENDDGELLFKANPGYLLKALMKYGMIPELLGRIPVIARLKALTKQELRDILTKSDESVLLQYVSDFKAYGTEVKFNESAYDTIAEKAFERGMGARGLGAVVEEALSPLKFHLPGTGVTEVEVTKQLIEYPLVTTLDIIQKHKKTLGG